MRRKNKASISMEMPAPPGPNMPNDHLAGQHYEDFMSEQFYRETVYPETPMRAAINGNNVWDDIESDWIARSRGEEVAKRRDWLEHMDPGGKTWKKGDIL